MKKKYIMLGLTCCFLLIAGICYSCSFKGSNSSAQLITSLEDGNKQKAGVNNISQALTEKTKSNKMVENNYSTDNNYSNKNITSSGKADNSVKTGEDAKKTWIYIHLCGEVKKPGVYRVEEGARLFTIVDLAGGFTKSADDDYMNQAQKVSDGQRIYIPTTNEVKKLNASDYMAGQESSEQTVTDNKVVKVTLVNINEASAEELMELPGIGKAKAEKIIEYRDSNGKFKKIEDIMNIPGIKEGLFQKFASYIVV